MKISRSIFAIIIAFTFLMASCRDTPSKKEESIEEHGHEHDSERNHMDDGPIEQEEFQVGKDSMEMKKESGTHSHDDGSEHHDH